MARGLVLTGYQYSVYTRAARIALAEKNVAYRYDEHNPFEPGAQGPHPFGRVPVLQHDDLRFYETAAITAYVDAAFDGVSLTPSDAVARARVEQVIGIVGSYAYWPLVRQVYSHCVFRPAFGLEISRDAVRDGLEAAPKILAALAEIAAEGFALGDRFTRADCHLAPMIAAFASAPQGAELLARYPALAEWWDRVSKRESVRATAVPLPTGRAGR